MVIAGMYDFASTKLICLLNSLPAAI